MGASTAIPMYLATSAGEVTQRKCWHETMAEIMKVDTKLTSTVEGGLYGT